MEITQQKASDILIIRLAGRLDASWCDPVENALTAAVREGEHRIHLDMEKVNYISSAGLRVIFTVYKQLLAIKGLFAISNPSRSVRSVLELSGIGSLIAEDRPESPVQAEEGRRISSPQADYELYSLGGTGMSMTLVGSSSLLEPDAAIMDSPVIRFDEDTLAVGIGALGNEFADSAIRLGEFLSLAGAAAFQPADGSRRPDYSLAEGSFVPEGHLPLGLLGRGDFSLLARFEAKKEFRSVGLAELAATALDLAQSPSVAIAAVTETSSLVGASLRQSPATKPAEDRLGFPQIREWLSFSAEPAFRDSTSLLVGLASREGSPFQPLLRPLGEGILGHFHAAVFPYRPLQKGLIELKPSVASLFDARSVSAVLHLLTDNREFNGAGESEFLRGALWIAPVHSANSNPNPAIA